jgi:hypothetical protein
VQELAKFEKYGDKAKLGALEGEVPFSKFTEAFHQTPTVRPPLHPLTRTFALVSKVPLMLLRVLQNAVMKEVFISDLTHRMK